MAPNGSRPLRAVHLILIVLVAAVGLLVSVGAGAKRHAEVRSPLDRRHQHGPEPEYVELRSSTDAGEEREQLATRPLAAEELVVAVTDALNQSIPSARVCVTQEITAAGDFDVIDSATTNEQGVAQFKGLPSQCELCVSAWAPGYLPSSAAVQQLNQGQPRRVSVMLDRGAEQVVELRWTEDGSPAAGVPIVAYASGYDTRVASDPVEFRTVPDQGFQRTTTDPQGIAILRGLGRGPWHLWLRNGWRFCEPSSADTRHVRIEQDEWPPTSHLKLEVGRQSCLAFRLVRKDNQEGVWQMPYSVTIPSLGIATLPGGTQVPRARGGGCFTYPVTLGRDTACGVVTIAYRHGEEPTTATVPLVPLDRIPASPSEWPQEWPSIAVDEALEDGEIRFLGLQADAPSIEIGLTRPDGSSKALVAIRRGSEYYGRLPVGEYVRASAYQAGMLHRSRDFVVSTQPVSITLAETQHIAHELRVEVRDDRGRELRNVDVRIAKDGQNWHNDPLDGSWPIRVRLNDRTLFGSDHSADVVVLAMHPDFMPRTVRVTLTKETRFGTIALDLPSK